MYLDRIFNIPASAIWSSAAFSALDFPVILGTTVFSALLVIVANLVVDLIYPFLDPRVTYTEREGD